MINTPEFSVGSAETAPRGSPHTRIPCFQWRRIKHRTSGASNTAPAADRTTRRAQTARTSLRRPVCRDQFTPMRRRKALSEHRKPAFDFSCGASSCKTSQCSASTPSALRTMSAAIQLRGDPIAQRRPCTMTKSPSATLTWFTYRAPSGRLLKSLKALPPRWNACAVLDVFG